MKQRCFNNIIFLISLSAVLFFVTGCTRIVGKCTYGERPPVTGIVKVKSVEKIFMDSKMQYRVKVEGFFKRDFIFEENEYNKCFKAAGYKTGSEIEGSIQLGGPCPPIYNLNICTEK